VAKKVIKKPADHSGRDQVINAREFMNELLAACQIGDVVEAATTQVGMFVEYSMAWAKARTKVDRSKAMFDAVKSKLQIAVRDDLMEAGGKFTEAKVQAEVDGRPEYSEAQTMMMNAIEAERIHRVGVDALNMRKDMIVVLSRFTADERNAGTLVSRTRIKRKLDSAGRSINKNT